MPTKIKSKSTSSKVRKRTGRGKNKKKPGCQRSSRAKKSTAAEFSSTLFTVKLQPKIAYQIKDEVSPFEAPLNDMARQLLASLNYGLKALGKKEFIRTAAKMEGDKIIEWCDSVLKSQVLPEGFKYNIDKDDNGYFFVLYKVLDFNQHWHYFQIKPIVKYLENKDKKLLGLYLSALNILRTSCGICTWFGGNNYGYESMIGDEWSFNDYINNFDTEDGDDENVRQEWIDCREGYISGDANKAEYLICKANTDINALKRGLRNYPLQNSVARLIRKIIAIAELDMNIYDFQYDSYNTGEDYYDGEPLRLIEQVTIIWEEDDKIFDIECEHLDIHAGEFGVMEPTVSIKMDSKLKLHEFSGTQEKQQFFKSLTDLFNYNYKLTRKISKQNERINKSHNG